MTKNVDIDKYGYSGYGVGSDRKSSFSFPSGGFGQNVIIFWRRYEFFCTHSDSWKSPTQGLEHTLTAEQMY